MIILDALSKYYPGASAPALHEINLTIPQGQILGIVGRSGAGKSTLLRSINMLERPSAGRVLIDDKDLTLLSPRQLRQQRQQMGMIFQHFNLLHARNVSDNIRLALTIAGVPKKDHPARIEMLLRRVRLLDKAHSWPSQLSGGQKQRVAIARALAAEPRYLLCDEATSALDPETTASILNLLLELQQELGITVVLITHDMAVVKRICHSVALLEHGRCLESGPLAQIMASPASSLRQMLIDDGEVERAFLRKYLTGGIKKCVA